MRFSDLPKASHSGTEATNTTRLGLFRNSSKVQAKHCAKWLKHVANRLRLLDLH